MELNREGNRKSGRELYDKALRASHREAAASMAVAVLTVLYFWGAVLLWEESDIELFSLPIWFVASCLGGYVVSILGVLFLVKRVFSDIALDEAADAYCRSEKKA